MPAFVYVIPSLPTTRSKSPCQFGHPLTGTTFTSRSILARSQSTLKSALYVAPQMSAQDDNFPLPPLDMNDYSDSGERDQPAATPSSTQFSALFDALTTKFSAGSRRRFQSSLAASAPKPGTLPSEPIPKSLINASLPGAPPILSTTTRDSVDDDTITSLLLDNPDFEHMYSEEGDDSDALNLQGSGVNALQKRGASSKKFRRKDASEPQNQTVPAVTVRDSYDEDLVFSMLAQSYAVSSDYLSPIDDAPLSSPLFSIDVNSNLTFSEDTVSRNLQHQAQPCIQSTAELEKTLSAINKRRAFLSAESAEDTLLPLKVDSATLSPENTQAPRPNKEQIESFFDDIREASVQNFFVDSVRDSLPVNPYALAGPDELSAVISRAPQIIASISSPPNAYRPFLALSSAIVGLQNPPCPRCQTPTEKEILEQDGVCETCYLTIFLQSPASNTPQDAFISREDIAREEARLAQQAASVVRASALGENAAATAENDPKTKQPSLSGFTSNGGNDSFGNGGSSRPGQNQIPSVGDGWRIAASDRSLRTINPIRNLVQNIQVTPNPAKRAIKLSVGDPTVYGNLAVSAPIVDSLCHELKSGRSNGYSLSMGDAKARAAIADRYSTSSSQLSADDVFITAGASGALELAIGALVNEGDNILLPSPGFPLFRTLAEGFGIECRFYELDPDQDWQVKLGGLSRVADKRTRVIIVNNPSNPCGSVFSREHMEDIMAVAAAMRLPVIADEVYADMVFTGEFNSFGTVSAEVPTLVVGGISKQFVVPGWRVGWVLVHDRENVFEKAGVRRGLRQLTTRMICANTPVQSVIPKMLEDHAGFQATMKELQANADFTAKSLQSIEGLRCVQAKGAMYVMVGVDVARMGLKDDMEFVERLYEEEAVFVLPGQCFKAPNFVRVVFAAPKEVLADAFNRMAAFCRRRIDSTR